VLADGRPIYSCDTQLLSAADKSIRTVEGLSDDGYKFRWKVDEAWPNKCPT
jgi:aerobic-type carbon monoxide dehydrogenase small subunit (CoxS/CutS family)